MERKLYDYFNLLEENHWWFVGRRRVIFDIIDRELPPALPRALDIGCGVGVNASHLQKRASEMVGMDMSEDAIRYTKERAPDLRIMKGEFPHVDFEEKFDLVTLFDVLEHFEDDTAALGKINSILGPGGHLVLTVPAYQMLWSGHDVMSHHKRRYTKRELAEKLTASSFAVERITYFNTFLFLPIIFFRAFKNLLRIRPDSSDLFLMPAVLNKILAFIFGLERWPLRLVNLPFGTSIYCHATKRNS